MSQPSLGARPLQHAPNIYRNNENNPTTTEAFRVRQNLIRSTWTGLTQLSKWKKFVLFCRLGLFFAQIAAFLPILCLGSSHGGSYTPGEICNPEPMFIYLLLHIIRLALSIPCELYLGLSPHRSQAARRAGPEVRARLERDRPVGSLYWDLKISKISDMLGFAALVLFIVGNYVVYSSTECSKPPADSVPLFWSALTSLIISYMAILQVLILAFLLTCALPLLIVLLRALGLTNRLPQRDIKPDTGKIEQHDVDRLLKLVYYTPAPEEDQVQSDDPVHNAKRRSMEELERKRDTIARLNAKSSIVDTLYAAGIDLPPSRPGTPVGGRPAAMERRETGASTASITQTALDAAATSPHHVTRLMRLFIPRRPRKQPASTRNAKPDKAKTETTGTQHVAGASMVKRKLKYPLHPLPAHRATCPICLCDFEEPVTEVQAGSTTAEAEAEDPEPLRLMACGHVLHKSCVDEWLTTVSGRCPVCQRPVLPSVLADQDGSDVEAQRTPATAAEGFELDVLPSSSASRPSPT